MMGHILHMLEAYGLGGLLILSFAEASFLPVPPELLLIPLCLAHPGKAIGYALMSTVASTGGAFFGYVLGKVLGHPLLHRFVSPKTVERIESLFQRYGVWVVLVAGMTPAPFKLFTISSGIFALNPPRFLLAAFIGRGTRYLVEAIAIWSGGAGAAHFLKHHYVLIRLGLVFILLIGLLIYRKKRQRGRDSKGLYPVWMSRVQKVLAGEGKTLKVAGEWMIALGCGAFLSFFLADIVSTQPLHHLYGSDIFSTTWLNPYLGWAGWSWLNRLLGPGLLTAAVVLTSAAWLKQKKQERIIFLLFCFLGSSAVLMGFDRIVLASYHLTGGTSPFPTALTDTLWASYILWMATGGRPGFRGRRLLIMGLGFLFLIVLALSRVAMGYLLSDVLVTYATAGLWLVVIWLIFLYRGTPEHVL